MTSLINKLLLLLPLLMVSCVSTRGANPISHIPGASQLTDAMSPESISNLSILSAVGGVCIVGGVIILVLPGASNLRAMNAILIGIVLILLNVGVQEYLPYIYIPFIVGTGIFSLAVTYRAVRYVLNWRKNKWKSSPMLRPSLGQCGSSCSSESSPSPEVSGHDHTS